MGEWRGGGGDGGGGGAGEVGGEDLLEELEGCCVAWVVSVT